MIVTEESLRRIGLQHTPEEFGAVVRQVINQLPALGARTSALNELTPEAVAALRRGGFNVEPKEYGLDDPYLRGIAMYTALVADGLTVAEAATLFSVDDSRIRQRLAKRTLYGVKVDNAWRLPTFQFHEQHLIPGFDQVAMVLNPELNPVTIYRWFTLPNVDLLIDGEQISPRAWLLHGEDPTPVVEQAAAL
jgi:hypothetical protein